MCFGIELLSFLLKDLFTVGFMLGDAVWIELSSTTGLALDELRRIVFLDINMVLSIDFPDWFVFYWIKSMLIGFISVDHGRFLVFGDF